MSLRTAAGLCAGLLLIAACGGAGETAPSATLGPNLDEIVLEPDGLGEVAFGASPVEVISSLEPFLGGPDEDTAWIDGSEGIYGRCPPLLRVISWGSLSVFFDLAGDGDIPAGDAAGSFFTYSYGFDYDDALAGVDPRDLDLATIGGVRLGMPGALLEDLGSDVVFGLDDLRNLRTFAIDPGRTPHLRGTLGGEDIEAPITFIETSTACA